jgi:ABC-type Co2+ transport system permease subunit
VSTTTVEKAGIVGVVALFALWATAIVGYIANIVQIVHMASGPITALFVVKCIGVIAGPLGSIMGIVGFFS